MKKIIFLGSLIYITLIYGEWQIFHCPGNNCLQAGVDGIKKFVVTMGLISDKPLSLAIQDLVKYFLSFLSIIAVIYIMYAGAQMLLNPASEASREKTKKIITSVIIGLTIIWLAWWIVGTLFYVLKGV